MTCISEKRKKKKNDDAGFLLHGEHTEPFTLHINSVSLSKPSLFGCYRLYKWPAKLDYYP